MSNVSIPSISDRDKDRDNEAERSDDECSFSFASPLFSAMDSNFLRLSFTKHYRTLNTIG